MAYDIFNDPNMAPGIQGVKISAQIAQGGVSQILTRTYKGEEEITTSFYSGMGQVLPPNEIPIGVGRVMITGQLVDSGVLRSDLDPTKLKKVLTFVTGEGPIKGIVGVDASKLENIYVGGKQVKTEVGQSQDVGLKEVAGSVLASVAVMKGVDYVTSLLGFDKETGDALPASAKSILGDGKKFTMDDIEGFDTANAKEGDIIAFDPKTKSMAATNFVDFFKKRGIEVDDIVVKKDGQIVSSDVMTFNFIDFDFVTDAGNKQVNIKAKATTSTDPGGGDGGTDPTPTPTDPNTCVAKVIVDCDPRRDSRFLFKRNGKLMGILLVDGTNASQFTSRASVASHLASKTIIPASLASYKFTISANSTMISISGDTTCKPCDIGTWTLECWSPPLTPNDQPQEGAGTPSPAVDPCAPRKPSLTT